MLKVRSKSGYFCLKIDVYKRQGTDIDSRKNLIACNHTLEEMEKIIDVDSLGFLDADHLNMLIGTAPGTGFCSACFDGNYPTEVPGEIQEDKFSKKISESK